ncbi:hypothetical protein [Pseudomonas sp. TTU2014-080ASC]|uniref:hypothetical protein n=1 Tax=Pseudomonas sp. TTU2014-080ASC TaxID=1729724 RepID=UPI0007185C46|nr:hypothetical protein [Pseudomonas sp. TTU2014-080ASC]KRW59496.1 hypothetical protein AO726_11825 [Pseudomonas sp. TTU2014-080ASC]
MIRLSRALVLLGIFSLGACVQVPVTPPVPAAKPGASSNHPRFAPPPGVQSRWDAVLGVYVVSGTPHLYYRERTYYRWDAGWSWSTSVSGPWTATDTSGVPPGLSRYYGH